MQFLYPALTAGFFLALLPLLIHLINMMRHRRVKWAAMEFLLQSYKKHRKWVWLQQLLLLLARMAAVALIVAMLAQLVTQRRYEGLFGSTLDASLRAGGRQYVDDRSSRRDGRFRTGARFRPPTGSGGGQAGTAPAIHVDSFLESGRPRARRMPNADTIPQIADLNAEDVDSKFPLRLEEIRTSLEPTELPVGPEAALQSRAAVDEAEWRREPHCLPGVRLS